MYLSDPYKFVKMEVMEEGNLMDRIRILLQRDSEYYQQNQSVLQENLCIAVVGGVLDFPHYASFAAAKMVLWWEEEHIAAFKTVSGLLQGIVSCNNVITLFLETYTHNTYTVYVPVLFSINFEVSLYWNNICLVHTSR